MASALWQGLTKFGESQCFRQRCGNEGASPIAVPGDSFSAGLTRDEFEEHLFESDSTRIVTLLQAMGVQADAFASSDGDLNELIVG